MCKFASFELTRTECFWTKSDRHQDMIEQFCPHKDGVGGPNSVGIELTPPRLGDWSDLSTWSFTIDQDTKPEWFDQQDVERRAREALARRSIEWPWLPLVAQERASNFARATSTDPADHERANRAARGIAKIGGLQGEMAIWWVDRPEEGKERYESLSRSLNESLYESLNESLNESLSRSLYESLYESLSRSLYESLYESLNESSWLSFYRSAIRFGANYREEDTKLLDLYGDLLDSCYACWLLPGHIILLDRPSRVEVVNGQVTDMKWDRHAQATSSPIRS